MQPIGRPRLLQQPHRALLDQARADAAQHIVAAPPLEDDVVDPRLMQQLPEQQPRGTRADDADLGAHAPSWTIRTGLGQGRSSGRAPLGPMRQAKLAGSPSAPAPL